MLRARKGNVKGSDLVDQKKGSSGNHKGDVLR